MSDRGATMSAQQPPQLPDGWTIEGCRALIEAAKTGNCDPECPECNPPKLSPVRAYNNTKATIALAALLALIVLGVLFA